MFLISLLISGMATAEYPIENPIRTVPRYRVRMAWSSRAKPVEEIENIACQSCYYEIVTRYSYHTEHKYKYIHLY